MKTLLLIFCLVLCSCAPRTDSMTSYADLRSAQNDDRTLNAVPTKVSPDGLHYKLVKIEGKTFVATQVGYGWWTLAGPID